MDFDSQVDKILASFTETTQIFKEMVEGTPNEYRAKIEQLHESSTKKRVEYAEALIGVKIQNQALNECLEDCYRNSTTYSSFKTNFKKRKEALLKEKTNVKDLNEFKKVKQAIEAAAKLNDEEIQGNVVFSIFDPWSKEVMLNPVRNKICGHIYERASVMRIMGESICTRCPVVGCVNKSFLHPDIMIPDEEVRQKVLRQLEEDEDWDDEMEYDDKADDEESDEDL